MAIIKYTVDDDITALKVALEATGFFDHFAYDDDETPTALSCYDSDSNLIFKVEAYVPKQATTAWVYTAYKSGGASIELNGWAVKNTTGKWGLPADIYIVGSKSAIFHFKYSTSGAAFLAIGKTNTETIGFAMPVSLYNNTGANEVTSLQIAAWDDDSALTTSLRIADESAPMVGNSVQFVPIPMHGVYGTPEFLENVYYMPMVQSGMRGLFQEITASDGNVYLTNGYIAAHDDIGITT